MEAAEVVSIFVSDNAKLRDELLNANLEPAKIAVDSTFLLIWCRE
jgi:hypothetical protein